MNELSYSQKSIFDILKYEHIKFPVVFDTWGVLMRRDIELSGNDRITSDMLAERPLIISRQLTDMSEWLGLPKKKSISSLHIILFSTIKTD